MTGKDQKKGSDFVVEIISLGDMSENSENRTPSDPNPKASTQYFPLVWDF